MVRPRKVNKEPMTSIAISEKLALELHKAKPFKRTIGDFVNILFRSYQEKNNQKSLREENEFLVETIEQNQRKIQEYLEVIEVLKKDKDELEKRLQIVQ